MKSYAVIGLGRFGSHIAAELYSLEQDVIAIDVNENMVQDTADSVTRAVAADAKDADILKALGVQNCDCAIVAIGSDLAASVLVTMNLKNLGVPSIICKAYDSTHAEILAKLGATQVVIPEKVVAEKLAASLASPNILEDIELSEDFGIIERTAPKGWAGKSLKELNVRAKYGVNIIAVKRDDAIFASLSADFSLRSGDILVILGAYTDLDKIK